MIRAEELAQSPVWVLDDPRVGVAEQAVGIAEHLGVRFQRIQPSLTWLSQVGAHMPAAARPTDAPAGPRLLIASGGRSGAAALWLKARLGCPIVHCLHPRLPLKLVGPLFDLLVIPHHDLPPRLPNVLPILGVPHRLSPFLLASARAAWAERLAHLPRPRLALLVGGPPRGGGLSPRLARELGEQAAQHAIEAGGAVLARTTRRTGAAAADALAAGLGRAMHVLYRHGEPDADPYLGFLATADTIIVTGDSLATISEACATDVPVFIALPELGADRHRRAHASLYAADQARPLASPLTPYARTPLDEPSRIAAHILRRFRLE
jgi:mitochondrial fission protein ELM1